MPQQRRDVRVATGDGWSRARGSTRLPAPATTPSRVADIVTLAHADRGSRARTLLDLQRSGGNAAVAAHLARRRAPDPRARRVAVEPVLQRKREPPKPKLVKTAFDRAALETIKTNAEKRHERITTFIRASRATLQTYKSRLLNAAVIYRAAFKRHKTVLDQAETAARDRAQMISTIAGFATGVVLGLPGTVARLGLTEFAKRAALTVSIGSEVTELGASWVAGQAGGEPGAGAFDPSAEIPELKELAVWQTVADMSDKLLSASLLTAKLLKIVSASGVAITEVRLREGGAKNLEKSDADLQTLVRALQQADAASAAVDEALDAASAEINQLGATKPPPLSVEEVEQNIWIEWIADLTDDDLLDEDEITDHLEDLGVIGEGHVYTDDEGGTYRVPPRLDVDFGSWVSDADERDAVNAAREKLGRRPPVPADAYYDEE